ncbi:MAG: hypothetical protein J6Z26_01690 [Bacteroidales bacterium]|nr:hypothetical protein [Bacteroidales bacterium]
MKQRTILVAALVLAAGLSFTSCSKDELDTNNQVSVQYGTPKHVTMQAELKMPVLDKTIMDATTTSADFGKVIWESGDNISVNNATMDLTEIKADDNTHALFEGTVAPATNIESGKDVYRSVYPASIVTNWSYTNKIQISIPATQTRTVGDLTYNNAYMAAYTATTSGASNFVLEYKNLCTMLKLQLKAAGTATGEDLKVSKIRFASTRGLSGEFDVTFNGGVPSLTPVSPSPANIIELDYSSTPITLSTADYTEVLVMLPATVVNEGFVMQIWNGDGSKRIEKTKANTTLPASQILTAPIDEEFVDWGRTYSVSSSQKVYFAHGNLKYKLAGTDAGAWRFFDQQYGMCTEQEVKNTLLCNDNLTQSGQPWFVNVPQDGDASYLPTINARLDAIHALDQWTDHFNFGCTGYAAGSMFYQPWHTFYGQLQAGGLNVYTGYGYGPMSGSTAQHLAGTNSDWGVAHRTTLNNSLTPSGNDWRTHRGEWRTPTQSEWLYVIQGAKRLDNIAVAFKYGLARIEVSAGNYVNGLMMIPDKWHWFLMPEAMHFKPFEAGASAVNEFADNTYTLAEWDVLDEYGAVFLPAGGTRIAFLMDYGKGGFYQSATAALNPVSNGNGWNTSAPQQRGFSMHFYSADANSAGAWGYPNGIAGVWGPQEGTYIGAFNKIDGHNVRLVRNTTDD